MIQKDLEQDVVLWSTIQRDLHQQYGDKLFQSWFSKINFLKRANGEVVLSLPSQFMKEWITENYFDLILSLWQHYDSSVQDLSFKVVLAENKGVVSVRNPYSIYGSGIQAGAFATNLDKRFTFENFVVGSPNELAYSASRAISEAKKAIPESNPLFLYGGVGLGKTHLMHSIAWYMLSHNFGRRFIYLSAEKFMYQFVSALRNKSLLSFKEQFRSVDVLMIDDIQFICGKDSTQEEFFHTFNTLIDNHRQIVISCDRSPSDLDNVEDRIKSRLGWGLVADVHSTTYELRIGILESKIEQMRVHVPSDVVEFLANSVTSNVRELEGALNKVVAHSNLMKKSINLDNTKSILKDLLKFTQKSVMIPDIQKKVAGHYAVSFSDMTSSVRARSVSRPRQIAMYLCKLLTPKSLAEIGKQFGNKDHTTVMHAIRKIEALCKSDVEFAKEVETLTRNVKA
ncbi:chromosomal replication initiator protein DnaA [Candidatus Sneabacter namystus]|uniref:Chromosomal replication initiator protein DnaA n=1 Tax=Candidatus Sneabacter namystus TaxID=2601646 RepID=A0A5C0UIN4_9RICK|nr:chromosomal replication initiator protein DnaA [Candidatus Sneabacter namystus]QEK39647.1 chromosomal replication initiator protein DnaA [Candidatus Sneabacter namystus]